MMVPGGVLPGLARRVVGVVGAVMDQGCGKVDG
jgi:hypothetical protein